MDDLVNALANGKVYSGLDLRSGYWQMCTVEESIEHTAFVMQLGKWEWFVLSMGLSTAPSMF